jgi:hypothetical protein
MVGAGAVQIRYNHRLLLAHNNSSQVAQGTHMPGLRA